MRVREWAFPAPAVRREVLRAEPAGSPPSAEPADTPSSAEPAEADTPTRPPLLFVHALGHAAWSWEEWLPAAADAGWSAHAVSLRAHGGSEGRSRFSRIRMAEYEHDVLQEATRLPRPPVVVAHSLGCVVAARVAARYPFAAVVLLAPVGVDHALDIVPHLIRHGPGHIARVATLQPLRLRSVDLFAGLEPAEQAAYVARLDPEPPIVQLQLLLRRPPGPPVGDPPVLVYGAELDTLVPASGVERTARYLGTQARWLSGVGHDVMLDRGNRAVLDQVLSDLEHALGLHGDGARDAAPQADIGR
jgi:pimeloyl-ACP methyl ester carboxylesterase